MNETAPRLDEAPYIHRPALEAAVVTAAAGRKRLILVGAVGSGRSTLLLRALGKARFKVHFVEMMGVLTKNGLAAAFQAHGVRRSARKAVPDIPMPQALRLLDEKALRHRHALILNNLDGCRGVDDEDAIVGALRSELQLLRNLSVFYTASNEAFVSKHFTSPNGAFFKQAASLEIPPLDPTAVDEIGLARTGTLLEERVRLLITSSIGLLPADIQCFFDRMIETRRANGLNASLPVRVDEVNALLAKMVVERKGQYDFWAASYLPPRHRAVLTAFGRGIPLRASSRMAAETGAPVRSLVGIIRAIKAGGCLVLRGGQLVFADPFLRLHLLNR